MGIVESLKDVLRVADAVNNLELYKKLSELQMRVMEVEEEKNALRAEVETLKGELKIKGSLEVNDNAYWVNTDGVRDGPFCLRCWDAEHKLIRERDGATQGTHYCPHCHLLRNRK